MEVNHAIALLVMATRRSMRTNTDKEGNWTLTKLVLRTEDELEALQTLLNAQLREEPIHLRERMNAQYSIMILNLDKFYEMTPTSTVDRQRAAAMLAIIEFAQAYALFIDKVFWPLRNELDRERLQNKVETLKAFRQAGLLPDSYSRLSSWRKL